jgi:hypothetical protein
MNKILLIALIVIIITTGFIFYASEKRNNLKETDNVKTSEVLKKTETPKLEKVKDNDLIMAAVRNESGASQELLANSCVSSIMQETDDLILVYISWNCGDVGGGTRAILKKEDGKYKFIAMFQDPPSCALMKEFSVPQSFYEACY